MVESNHVALFPGQGALSPGVGQAWRATPSWSLVEEAEDTLAQPISAWLLEASLNDIVRTDRAQLATFVLSLVGYREACSRGYFASHFVGHSLGEISALTAAGVLSFHNALHLVDVRGRAMAAAQDAQPGGMTALMGGDGDAVDRLVQIGDLWVANVNGDGQIVAAGTIAALDELDQRARDLGFKRATRLNVGGAFHTPMMSPAAEALAEALRATTFNETDRVVVANVDGLCHHGGPEWTTLLLDQLTNPVQFVSAIRALPGDDWTGTEFPPSGVLVGLCKRIRDFRQLSSYEPEEAL